MRGSLTAAVLALACAAAFAARSPSFLKALPRATKRALAMGPEPSACELALNAAGQCVLALQAPARGDLDVTPCCSNADVIVNSCGNGSLFGAVETFQPLLDSLFPLANASIPFQLLAQCPRACPACRVAVVPLVGLLFAVVPTRAQARIRRKGRATRR